MAATEKYISRLDRFLMNPGKRLRLFAGIVIASLILNCTPPSPPDNESADARLAEATDPLPSWNDGRVKSALIDFVEKVTKEGSSDYIPPSERIATFDNDGTLWAEQPTIQAMFALVRAEEMLNQDPSLKSRQPFKAVAENDQQYLHHMSMDELMGLVVATHTGMKAEEFEQQAQQFFEMAKHPTLGVPISQLVYKPQRELLQYLRDHGFKTFICSGGTAEFMRAICEKYYGIEDEQIIGSSFKYSFDEASNSIHREPVLSIFDDKKEKPVNIQHHIGKRPVFACGNEKTGGDIYMLRFSQGNKYASFQLLINHDDEQREFLYQEKDSISLKWAEKYKWNVVSIKNDWKEVFVK